jgi:hypothetical protein
MGADTTVDGLGSGTAECLGSSPESCPGSRDVVDQQYRPAIRSCSRRKTLLGQLEAAGSGAAGLTTETVPPQKTNHRSLEPPGYRLGE